MNEHISQEVPQNIAQDIPQHVAATRNQTIFYVCAFLIVSILAVLVFWPFLVVLTMAGIVAILTRPVYEKFRSILKSEGVSAVLTLLLVLIVTGLPLAFIGNQIIVEAQDLYTKLTTGADVSVTVITSQIETYVRNYIPDFTLNIREYLTGFSSWIVSNLGGFFTGTVDIILKLALFVVALFFFIRDGEYFKKHLVALSPLPDIKNKILTNNIKVTVNSVLLGSLVVALIQGFMTGVGFAIFGVPNYTLWGTAAAIAALIPGVGTGLVWVPAVIYLFFVVGGWSWIGQALWSIFLVGLIDNFLGPFIINKGVNIHPLIILFSILGGVQLFGPEGVILGPLIISLLFALLKLNVIDDKESV